LNHSVTFIGWGVDKETGKKYWIMRNSYGGDWGDSGDFLIERGVDFGNVEGEATYYEPALCTDT
jgi:cathepsin C